MGRGEQALAVAEVPLCGRREEQTQQHALSFADVERLSSRKPDELPE